MTRLELLGITKTFGRQRVLNHVWLQLRAGEAVGLVGRNGAGKTTLLRIAAGLVQADDGLVLWADSRPALRYFGGEMAMAPDVLVRRWPRIVQLRGNRQSLGLRLVLSGSDADVLLLDEPWEGLDRHGGEWLSEKLRQWRDAGAAMLISSHRLGDLDSVCTRYVTLEAGRCVPLTSNVSRRSFP